MQVQLVKHIIVERCIVADLLLHRLQLGAMHDKELLIVLAKLRKLSIAGLQFFKILLLFHLLSIIKLVNFALSFAE